MGTGCAGGSLCPVWLRAVAVCMAGGGGSCSEHRLLLHLDCSDSAPVLALHIEMRHHRAALLAEHLLEVHAPMLAGDHLRMTPPLMAVHMPHVDIQRHSLRAFKDI